VLTADIDLNYLRAAVATAVETDPSIAGAIVTAAHNATPAQQRAIAAGLSDAARFFARLNTPDGPSESPSNSACDGRRDATHAHPVRQPMAGDRTAGTHQQYRRYAADDGPLREPEQTQRRLLECHPLSSDRFALGRLGLPQFRHRVSDDARNLPDCPMCAFDA